MTKIIAVPDTYDELREIVQDGDMLAVSGKGLISLLIRMCTFGKMSHTANFFFFEGSLMITEYKEFIGPRICPASLAIKDYLDAGTKIYFCQAPKEVHANPEKVRDFVMKFRNGSYGFRALVLVLFVQLLRVLDFKFMPSLYRGFVKSMIEVVGRSNAIVCSRYTGMMFRACGVDVEIMPSPQVMPDYCQNQIRIRGMGDRVATIHPDEVGP